MHTVLLWLHVWLTTSAFSALPLGRLEPRSLLSRASHRASAQAIARIRSGIVMVGGLSLMACVLLGSSLRSDTALTPTWGIAPIALIVIAGIAIEDGWLNGLTSADGAAFEAVLHERVRCPGALAGPAILLFILWRIVENQA